MTNNRHIDYIYKSRGNSLIGVFSVAFGIYLSFVTGNLIYLLSFSLISVWIYNAGRGEIVVSNISLKITKYNFLFIQKENEYFFSELLKVNGVLAESETLPSIVVETKNGGRKSFEFVGLNLYVFEELKRSLTSKEVEFRFGRSKTV